MTDANDGLPKQCETEEPIILPSMECSIHPYQPVIDFTAKFLSVMVLDGEQNDPDGLRTVSPVSLLVLQGFLTRLLDGSRVPSECFPVALLYLLRLKLLSGWKLTRSTMAPVFTSALIIASKWLEDKVLPLFVWAKLANVEKQHLFQMEREMLYSLQWNLDFSTDEYTEVLAIGNLAFGNPA